MSAAIILKVVHGRESSDCAVAALAMYLGVTYEDVLRAVVKADEHGGKGGLFVDTIKQIARRLGTPLRERQRVDLDDDYGILIFKDHVAVLRNGLIFNPGTPDTLIWDAHDYLLTHTKAKPEGILIAAERPRRRRKRRAC